jgi:1,2-phenylacetyl-CoA epoxidase catalytic subunit
VSRLDGLLRVAEDRFLHGHLLGRWITDYVDLEESLAVGSIAQEELAHAATLMEFAGLDDEGRDAFIFERPAGDWQPSALVAHRLHDWPAAVLRGYLLASVGEVGSVLLSHARRPELQSAGQVIAAEQRLHVTHWERWVTMLGKDERTADELRARAAEVLPLATDVFGSPAFDQANGEAAHAAWVDSVSGPLSAVGVSVEALGRTPTPRGALGGSELVDLLDEIRSLRVGAGDGVRGLYR